MHRGPTAGCFSLCELLRACSVVPEGSVLLVFFVPSGSDIFRIHSVNKSKSPLGEGW